MSSVKLVGRNKSSKSKNSKRSKTSKGSYASKRSDNNVIADISDRRFDMAVKIIFGIITAVYGGLCLYLYYKQSIQPADKDTTVVRLFESDLPFHLSMVIDDGWYYSLTALIYLVLYNIAGKSTVLIAVFLALVTVGTVLVTERILTKLGIKKKAITCGGAIVLNVLMPFYIKKAGMYRYVSYQSGNVWHNSTYQCMKLAALICLLMFLVIEKKVIKGGIKAKDLILFAVALAVCTGIKPSFLTVFAPAFAVKLLINWLKDKVPFKRILLWGLTVLPSCGVVLWQNAVLFGDDTDNGYKISFMETFSLHADHPKITVLLSLAFPLVVFVCYVIDLIRHGKIKKLAEDRRYLFAILMSLVGFAEAAILIETGSRSRDGNFLWGYAIALVWLYILSLVKWYKLLERKRWFLFGTCSIVLAYQYYCGIVFFSKLVAGTTYFMYY